MQIITLTNEAEIEAKFKIDAYELIKAVHNDVNDNFYFVSEEGVTLFKDGDFYDVASEEVALQEILS